MTKLRYQRYDNRDFPLVRFTLGALPERLRPVLVLAAGPDGPAGLSGGAAVGALLGLHTDRQISDLDFFCTTALRPHLHDRLLETAPDHAFSESLSDDTSRTTLLYCVEGSGSFLKTEIEFHPNLDVFVQKDGAATGVGPSLHVAHPHTLIAKYVAKMLTPGGCPWAPAKLAQRRQDILALLPLACGPRVKPAVPLADDDRQRLNAIFGGDYPALSLYLEGAERD